MRILTATLAAGCLALSIGVAHATVFSGAATFIDTTNTNSLNITGSPNPAPFTTTNITAGNSSYITGFITLSSTDTANPGIFGNTQTDSVSLTLNFVSPSSATETQGGTGTEFVSLLGFLDSGSIRWTGDTNVDSNGRYAQTLVSFSDGASAYVDVYDSTLAGTTSSRSALIDMKIGDLKDPIPEPATLSILGAGLFGLGMNSPLEEESGLKD